MAAIEGRSQLTLTTMSRPEEAGWQWASLKPGRRVLPARSSFLVAALARWSTSSFLPTARKRPLAMATACARGCASSTVKMLALWRISSGFSISSGNIEKAATEPRNSRRVGLKRVNMETSRWQTYDGRMVCGAVQGVNPASRRTLLVPRDNRLSLALAEREVAGADVGVQPVLAGAVLFEGAEQAAVRFMEGCRFEVTGEDGGINVAVVRSIADGDGQVAGVEFDVGVTRNALDRKVSGGHANKEHSGAGNFDGDFKIVSRAAEDAEVRVIIPALEAHGEIAGVVGITPAKVHRNLVIAATYDPKFPGTQVQAQLAAGREIHRKRMILKIFDLDFGVRKARRHQQGQRRKQGQN